MHDQAQESYLLIRTTLRKEHMGQRNFKEPFEFHSFSEIFYCGMTRLRNKNLDVFMQCQHTITILRNKNMGQSLFNKKYLKFQKFDETLYCGMTRFKKVILGVFRQYQNTKSILKKKNIGQNRFKKLSKFQKFHIGNFTLTWSNEGKMNLYNDFFKRTTAKNENFGQIFLKKLLN